jgi:hypothetical protein
MVEASPAPNVKYLTCALLHLRYSSTQPVVGCRGFAAMTTRRLIFWWFRFVLSGRFLDRFLSLPRAPRP